MVIMMILFVKKRKKYGDNLNLVVVIVEYYDCDGDQLLEERHGHAVGNPAGQGGVGPGDQDGDLVQDDPDFVQDWHDEVGQL